MTDREKVMEICKKCIDSGEPAIDYHFYYSVLRLLKEQDVKDINVPGKWISVKDRLPNEDTGAVIAFVNYGHSWYRMIAWHGTRIGWISDDPLFRKEDSRYVTHWMPMPEPPKKVKTDG